MFVCAVCARSGDERCHGRAPGGLHNYIRRALSLSHNGRGAMETFSFGTCLITHCALITSSVARTYKLESRAPMGKHLSLSLFLSLSLSLSLTSLILTSRFRSGQLVSRFHRAFCVCNYIAIRAHWQASQ
jgi:hypothetical protein